MSDELRPCPFCGGPVAVFPVYDEYDSVIGFAGWCAACGGTAQTCGTEVEAARRWNTRPVEDALRAERDAALAEAERLRAELDAVPWDAFEGPETFDNSALIGAWVRLHSPLRAHAPQAQEAQPHE